MIDTSKLSKYDWWQLKKHSKAKKPVYSCTIQDPKDKSTYYSATEEKEQAAIDGALGNAMEAGA